MRQFLPQFRTDVEPYEAYRVPDGPFLRLNMVASADGRVTDPAGRSGGLAGSGDRLLFFALRALADAILVGAGTARIEGYGPHRLRKDLARRRAEDGRNAPAAVVVVSASLDLDLTTRLFTEAVTPTVVLTCHAAPPDRLSAVAHVARVVVAGDTQVDLRTGLELLRADLGLSHVLCEGGPTLNTGLLTADLVDELCLTISPLLVTGGGPAMVAGTTGERQLKLESLYEHNGELFARYRLPRPHPTEGVGTSAPLG